ncbi:FAD-dependent monooxygenase [Streptomyces sp. NPDC059455]|uniref:FAD-dependent monooxygenase n=1 Tax=Streptomyces sp. NPDC059455 TaxID=3346837 RepID=UPI0036A8738B
MRRERAPPPTRTIEHSARVDDHRAPHHHPLPQAHPPRAAPAPPARPSPGARAGPRPPPGRAPTPSRSGGRTGPATTVSFGQEAIGHRVEQGRSVLTVRGADGDRELSARYVVAADGGRSAMRNLTGIKVERGVALGQRVNIYFHADLAAQTRNRPYLLWTIMAPDTQGIFIALDGHSRWLYSIELLPGETLADYTQARAVQQLRLATGVPDLEPDIRSMLLWTIGMGVATRFSTNGVFFAGDAAHTFPPMGGLGMNSGIQDGHNLAWKLAAVLRGGAAPELLDTYEAERRPVALLNAEQCMANAAAQQQAAKMMSDPALLDLMASEAGAEVRAQFAAGVEVQKAEFHSQGQQFGYVYDSDALIPDGTVAPTSKVAEYRATAAPGARLPHLRLVDTSGNRPSTVELSGTGWLVLAGPAGRSWIDAAAQVTAFGFLGAVVIGAAVIGGEPGERAYAEAVPGSFSALYGIENEGAVLVRPDGHVAARWSSGVPDAAGALRAVAEKVLARGTAVVWEIIGD